MPLKNILQTRFPRFYMWLLHRRSQMSLITRRSLIREYLKSTPHPKLQAGSGRYYIDGWLNTDYLAKHPHFIFLDATRPFPLPSDTFERIFSEHMIEHIPLSGGENLLAESFRILKPGGRIRIETPDLEKISNLYTNREKIDAQKYCQWHEDECGTKRYRPTICFAINNIMRYYNHLFLYDGELLRLMLEKAGFREVKQYSWGETADAEFKNISQRAGVGGTEYESLAIEATKPG